MRPRSWLRLDRGRLTAPAEATGLCGGSVLLAGGQQLVQQGLHLGQGEGERPQPSGEGTADVPAGGGDHVAAATMPDDLAGDAGPPRDAVVGQPPITSNAFSPSPRAVHATRHKPAR